MHLDSRRRGSCLRIFSERARPEGQGRAQKGSQSLNPRRQYQNVTLFMLAGPIRTKGMFWMLTVCPHSLNPVRSGKPGPAGTACSVFTARHSSNAVPPSGIQSKLNMPKTMHATFVIPEARQRIAHSGSKLINDWDS